MQSIVVKVTDTKVKKNVLVHKLTIDQSGFIYISENRIKFSPNILDLQVNEDTLRVQLNGDEVIIQSVPYYTNYLYKRVIHELPLLFKSFNNEYEEIDIRDQIYLDSSLYVVKFVNFNGTFRLNNVS